MIGNITQYEGALLIDDAQRAIHELIQSQGGYWRPTSATLHLYETAALIDRARDHQLKEEPHFEKQKIERLSSTSEGVRDENKNGLRIKTELLAPLMELFASSLCISTQYCVDLREAYCEAGLCTDILKIVAEKRATIDLSYDLELRLNALRLKTNEIGEIITYYDYERASATPIEVRALKHIIPEYHLAILDIFACSEACFAKFFAHNLEVAETAPEIFERRFNPSTASCLEIFKQIKNESHCPFAKAARLWGAPSYNESLSFNKNLEQALPFLESFTRAAKNETLDGFVFEFPVSSFGSDMSALCTVVQKFIEYLLQNDSTNPRDFDKAEITSSDWRFNFHREDFFVNVFSPLYDKRHSRHSYSAIESIFIMLQPEASFHRRIPKHLYQSTREEINQRFEQALQGYRLDPLEAHKFILPERDELPPVAWYGANPFGVEKSKVAGFMADYVATGIACMTRGFSEFLQESNIAFDRRVAIGRDAEIFHQLKITPYRLPISRCTILPAGTRRRFADMAEMNWEVARLVLTDLAKLSNEPVLIDIGYRGTLSRALELANARFQILKSLSTVLLFSERNDVIGWIQLNDSHRELTRNATAFEALIKSYEPPITAYTEGGPVESDIAYPLEQKEFSCKIRKRITEIYPFCASYSETQSLQFAMDLIVDPPMELCKIFQGWIQDEVFDGIVKTIPLIPTKWTADQTNFLDVAWLAGTKRLFESESNVLPFHPMAQASGKTACPEQIQNTRSS